MMAEMKLASSLHRLGSSLVNSYLVEEAGLVTIVDAGLPGYWGDLPEELAAMGRSLDDVRAVVLTHGDTDHVGFAERIRRERGVPVYVHELDAARARAEVKKPSTGWGPVKIRPLAGFSVSRQMVAASPGSSSPITRLTRSSTAAGGWPSRSTHAALRMPVRSQPPAPGRVETCPRLALPRAV